MTEKESLSALRLAREAFGNGQGSWPSMGVAGRTERVERMISLMMPMRERIARLLMWEIGKTYRDSLAEFDRTVRYAQGVCAAFAAEGRDAARTMVERGIAGRVGKAPLGVVLCMGPFNYPLFETFTGIIPALLAGNSVVFKPPRFGTLPFSAPPRNLRGCFFLQAR
jgi:acyl-CoA reductase-like NAD-dependent aldehyde dehydrogenase